MATTPTDTSTPADSAVHIRDFRGYMPAADPHDLPAGGALIQVNAVSIRPGELRVRPGYAVVKFDQG